MTKVLKKFSRTPGNALYYGIRGNIFCAKREVFGKIFNNPIDKVGFTNYHMRKLTREEDGSYVRP